MFYQASLKGVDEGATYDTMTDQIDETLDFYGYAKHRADYRSIVIKLLRGTFYQSTHQERLYLSKLSRTYSLLFALHFDVDIAFLLERLQPVVNCCGADLR